MSSEDNCRPSINDITNESLRQIISFIGLSERMKSLAVVNEALSRACRGLLLYHGGQALDGRSIVESQGRIFIEVIDCLRFAAYDLQLVDVSPKACGMLEDSGGIQRLRDADLIEDLQRMNAAVYSYWDSCAGNSKFGVINWFERMIKEHPDEFKSLVQPLKNDARFFKQDRIFGNFVLLFDTPSGAILVADDFKRVYLALGITDSIGHVLGFRKPFYHFSHLIGYPMTTTLLPWEGKIVYDGLLISPGRQVKRDTLQRAIRAYVKAVDSNTLFVTLSRKPLSRAPSNSRGAETVAGGTKAGGPAELKIRLQSKINSIASMHTYLTTSDPMSNWVFRRFGYTVQDNPNFIVTVLGSSINSLGVYPCARFKDLEPTVEEILDLLLTSCNSIGGKKPAMIFTDAESLVAPLKELLKDAGLQVAYYPPPSPEEAQLLSTSRKIAASAASRTGTTATRGISERERACARCGRLSAYDGSALMKCSRCHQIYYCCREHQKEHWQFHKHECSP